MSCLEVWRERTLVLKFGSGTVTHPTLRTNDLRRGQASYCCFGLDQLWWLDRIGVADG